MQNFVLPFRSVKVLLAFLRIQNGPDHFNYNFFENKFKASQVNHHVYLLSNSNY